MAVRTLVRDTSIQAYYAHRSSGKPPRSASASSSISPPTAAIYIGEPVAALGMEKSTVSGRINGGAALQDRRAGRAPEAQRPHQRRADPPRGFVAGAGASSSAFTPHRHALPRRQVEAGALDHPAHALAPRLRRTAWRGASVLLRKPCSYAEIYNGLHGEIVNLLQVARDDGERLACARELTPFSRAEFECSGELAGDLEQARRTVFRSFSASAAAATGQSSGSGANSNCKYHAGAHDPTKNYLTVHAVVKELARRPWRSARRTASYGKTTPGHAALRRLPVLCPRDLRVSQPRAPAPRYRDDR